MSTLSQTPFTAPSCFSFPLTKAAWNCSPSNYLLYVIHRISRIVFIVFPFIADFFIANPFCCFFKNQPVSAMKDNPAEQSKISSGIGEKAKIVDPQQLAVPEVKDKPTEQSLRPEEEKDKAKEEVKDSSAEQKGQSLRKAEEEAKEEDPPQPAESKKSPVKKTEVQEKPPLQTEPEAPVSPPVKPMKEPPFPVSTGTPEDVQGQQDLSIVDDNEEHRASYLLSPTVAARQVPLSPANRLKDSRLESPTKSAALRDHSGITEGDQKQESLIVADDEEEEHVAPYFLSPGVVTGQGEKKDPPVTGDHSRLLSPIGSDDGTRMAPYLSPAPETPFNQRFPGVSPIVSHEDDGGTGRRVPYPSPYGASGQAKKKDKRDEEEKRTPFRSQQGPAEESLVVSAMKDSPAEQSKIPSSIGEKAKIVDPQQLAAPEVKDKPTEQSLRPEEEKDKAKEEVKDSPAEQKGQSLRKAEEEAKEEDPPQLAESKKSPVKETEVQGKSLLQTEPEAPVSPPVKPMKELPLPASTGTPEDVQGQQDLSIVGDDEEHRASYLLSPGVVTGQGEKKDPPVTGDHSRLLSPIGSDDGTRMVPYLSPAPGTPFNQRSLGVSPIVSHEDDGGTGRRVPYPSPYGASGQAKKKDKRDEEEKRTPFRSQQGPAEGSLVVSAKDSTEKRRVPYPSPQVVPGEYANYPVSLVSTPLSATRRPTEGSSVVSEEDDTARRASYFLSDEDEQDENHPVQTNVVSSDLGKIPKKGTSAQPLPLSTPTRRVAKSK